MNTRCKTAIALFATFAVFGATIAAYAAPVAADTPDCSSVCNFGFGLPSNLATGSMEVGLQFQADVPGWISGICFWETLGETGNHAVTLWDSSGNQVAATSGPGSPGPESCVDFVPPAPISANTTYTASFTSNTSYGVEAEQFQFPGDYGHLHAPVNAGVLGAPGSFPTDAGTASNGYGVDVAFLSTLDGQGADCTSTLTAPGSPSSAPGNASATVSWAPASSDPAGCIAGYIVTPFIGGVSQRSTVIPGLGTTTVISGLTNGQSYTFTVAAESGRALGPPSTATGPVTVGTPSAPTALKVARVGKGAIKVSFKPSRSNGAKTKRFTATCTSARGPAKSKAGASSPLTVTGLAAHRTYRCKVRGTNARGAGKPSVASAAVKL
jgi:Domain of unknown function (DUF4082)/Fibronectin type III domain